LPARSIGGCGNYKDRIFGCQYNSYDFVIVSRSMRILGTVEAARRLGISDARVRSLIASERLKAVKVGGAWLIDPKDLEAVKVRKVGRPRKACKSTKQ
jgi:excisionase family DNA binding protein